MKPDHIEMMGASVARRGRRGLDPDGRIFTAELWAGAVGLVLGGKDGRAGGSGSRIRASSCICSRPRRCFESSAFVGRPAGIGQDVLLVTDSTDPRIEAAFSPSTPPDRAATEDLVPASTMRLRCRAWACSSTSVAWRRTRLAGWMRGARCANDRCEPIGP